MNGKVTNMGGLFLDLKVTGIDEALDKLANLNQKLEEANALIKELASMKVCINLEQLSQDD